MHRMVLGLQGHLHRHGSTPARVEPVRTMFSRGVFGASLGGGEVEARGQSCRGRGFPFRLKRVYDGWCFWRP